jgi:hypothetical protein
MRVTFTTKPVSRSTRLDGHSSLAIEWVANRLVRSRIYRRIPVRIPVALSLALVLAVAGIAAAQAPTSGSTAAKKTDVQKPASRSVSGTVKSASLGMVVVAGRDKGKDAEWTFTVEPTTNIRKGDKSIVAGDLKPGDAVQVRFTEQDGRAMARSILVKSKDAAAKKTRS